MLINLLSLLYCVNFFFITHFGWQSYLNDKTPNPTPTEIESHHSDAVINIKSFGAFGDGFAHPLSRQEYLEHRHNWKGQYQVGDQWDNIALQEAVHRADANTIIYIPNGNFLLDELLIKSNTSLIGNNAVLKSSRNGQTLIKFLPEKKIANIQISKLSFEDVGFDLSGTLKNKAENVSFNHCVFKETKKVSNTFFLRLSYLKNALIDACTFRRDIIGSGQQGVRLYRSDNIHITNCEFTGYYKSVINIFGALKNEKNQYPQKFRNSNILINDNRIQRVNGYMIKPDKKVKIFYPEDHGIYAWGMSGLEICGNIISGWSPTASGAAIKIRNGEDVVIRNNMLFDSGILAYTYEGKNKCNTRSDTRNLSCPPPYLKNIDIVNNWISLQLVRQDHCQGIVYWRNFGTQFDNKENNILISGNRIINGCIRIKNAYSPGFKIIDNEADEYEFQSDGINHLNSK